MNDFNVRLLIMYHCGLPLASRDARHASAAWPGGLFSASAAGGRAFPEATPSPTHRGRRAHTVVIFGKGPQGTVKQWVKPYALRLPPSGRGRGMAKIASRRLPALVRGRGAAGFLHLSSLMMKSDSRRALPVA